MTDNVDRDTRSKVMAAVRSSGNRSTEARLRDILTQAEVTCWREQAKDLPGVPDFVFDKERVAIFVDGCFWHGCSRCYRRPSSSQEYWDEKVQTNMKRDRRVRARLRRQGWAVLRVWEHSLSEPDKVVRRIKAKLAKRQNIETEKEDTA